MGQRPRRAILLLLVTEHMVQITQFEGNDQLRPTICRSAATLVSVSVLGGHLRPFQIVLRALAGPTAVPAEMRTQPYPRATASDKCLAS